MRCSAKSLFIVVVVILSVDVDFVILMVSLLRLHFNRLVDYAVS